MSTSYIDSPSNFISACRACSNLLTFRARGLPEKSDQIIAEELPGRVFSICEDRFSE